jgi:tryptophan 2,3-dioxygenase
LHAAVAEWLHRTPINGSSPAQADDGTKVLAFAEAYLGAHARVTRGVAETARAQALTPEDAKRVSDRFEREIVMARSYVLAEDEPERTRPRVARIRAALLFIESYRELALLAWPRDVLDALVALEQAFVVFRQRHARMVERIIGRRTGTGGSTGVDYLDQTALRYRIFRDVWAVRTLLVAERDLPPLENAKFYGFVGG